MSEKKNPTAGNAAGRVNKNAISVKSAYSDGFCVYIGPSITGVIQKGTIYRGSKNSVTNSLSYAIGKFPLIATLIVPGDKLPEAMFKIKTPGNLLYVNYNKLISEITRR